MKRFTLLLPVVVLVVLLAAFVEAETIKIGTELPTAEVEMEAADGKKYTLNDLNGESGLLVIFSCNTCPFVVGSKDSEGWDGRYNGVYEQCQKNGIGMVLINSNKAKRENGDSMEDMRTYASERNFVMPYVLDKDHVVADAFGARTTPHIFLFGKEGSLEYKGAIDDNVESAKSVSQHWLNDAISAMSDGKKIDPQETRNKGCSIKRAKKS